MIIKNPHVIKTKVLPLPFEKPIEIMEEKKPGISKWMWLANAGIIAGVLIFGLEVDAFATTGGGGMEKLEEGARRLYFDTVLGIAKWVIIAKGGWDTVAKALQEDFSGAKKSFIQYMMIFGALYALPIALNYMEEIFTDAL